MSPLLYLIWSLIQLSGHQEHGSQLDGKAVAAVNRCTLYIEGNGSVNCTGDVRRNVCDIECDGKYEGAFICTPEKGWSAKLPHCAREVVKENAAGCPLNENFVDCVSPCNDCIVKGKCKFLICVEGCDCKEGYVRNNKGVCIPVSECPAKDAVAATAQVMSHGCPDIRTCDAFCKSTGEYTGLCIGLGRLNCLCV